MDKIKTTIEREYLCEIAAGRKRVEYREIKPYWERHLFRVGRPFLMRLINGMQPHAPEVTVEISRVRRNTRSRQFALSIARVVEIKNWSVRYERPTVR